MGGNTSTPILVEYLWAIVQTIHAPAYVEVTTNKTRVKVVELSDGKFWLHDENGKFDLTCTDRTCAEAIFLKDPPLAVREFTSKFKWVTLWPEPEPKSAQFVDTSTPMPVDDLWDIVQTIKSPAYIEVATKKKRVKIFELADGKFWLHDISGKFDLTCTDRTCAESLFLQDPPLAVRKFTSDNQWETLWPEPEPEFVQVVAIPRRSSTAGYYYY